MTRGTTPINTFTTNMDISNATALYVTYMQDNRTIVEKELANVDFVEGGLQVQLSQAETLAFSSDKTKKIYIQIRAALPDGNRIASNIIATDIHAILKDGEI